MNKIGVQIIYNIKKNNIIITKFLITDIIITTIKIGDNGNTN